MKFFQLLLVTLCLACEELPRTDALPQSFGTENSLVLIMNPELAEDSLGKTIRSYFEKDFPGASQKSPSYIVHERWENMSGHSKEHHLQFYIIDLSDSSDEAMKHKVMLSKELSACDTFPCLFQVSNKWSIGQQVIGIAGHGSSSIHSFFHENTNAITELCEHSVQKSYQRTMLLNDELSTLNAFNIGNLKARIKTDIQTKIVTQSDYFNWWRKSGPEFEQSIFAWHLPYFEDSLIQESLIWKIKDSLCSQKTSLFEGIRNVEAEKRIPLRLKRIKLNNIFVLEAVGQWKMSDQPGVGGTFISYIIPISKEEGSIYLEGFEYAPGEGEPEVIRKLKIILNTIELDING